jgi:hypothetical protein
VHIDHIPELDLREQLHTEYGIDQEHEQEQRTYIPLRIRVTSE